MPLGDLVDKDSGKTAKTREFTAEVLAFQPTPSVKSPSPPFRREREGPSPQGWEGEVGGSVNLPAGPPHPALCPGRRGERVKKSVVVSVGGLLG